jgi:hypothetical protein
MKKYKFILQLLTALFFSLLLGSVFATAMANFQLYSPMFVKTFGICIAAFSFGISLVDFSPHGAIFMSYVKASVYKPGDNKGKGGDKKDKLILFDWDDVLTVPARDSKGIVITGNFAFNPGAYMVELYVTPESYKKNAKAEGETDAKGIMQQLDVTHPGDSVDIREFRSYWMNRNVGVIIQKCSDGTKDLLGAPCAPLQMVFDANDDKDKNNSAFTFKSALKGPDIADYQGTLTFDTLTGTVAANATTVDLTNGEGRYQLTTGAAAIATITTCSNAVDGMVFTLIGSGGTYPSNITKANDFVLSNGTTWSGIAGAEITFKAFKSDAAAWKFIELSRK